MPNKLFTIILMVFLHIVDDYYLQKGILAMMKQKSWWEENYPQPLYKHDYIWALLMHSFSWAFMIMLPIAYRKNFSVNMAFVIVLLINTFIHAIVDDLKANEKKIDLWTDQIAHMMQIAATAFIFLYGGILSL